MKWLIDGRCFVFVLVFFAASPVAALLAQDAGDPIGGAAALNEPVSAGAARPKYVLSGPNGTFHLIGHIGTVHYWVKCSHHDSCCCRVPYLAKLSFFHIDKEFIYYRVTHGDPATRYFAIRRHSSFCRHYAIWRLTSHGREFFGYYRLQMPH
jgi:hypothetical protein